MIDDTDVTVEDAHDRVTVVQAAAGSTPEMSVADTLRANYEAAKTRRRLKRIMLPNYGEEQGTELWVTFRVVTDYREAREKITNSVNMRTKDKATREIETALATLSMAAVGSYAMIGDTKKDIGEPLGLGLYNYLGLPAGPVNDGQAITLLFHENTSMIVAKGLEVDRWMSAGGPEEDDEIVGESQAA